jgi:mediator of RNA polymerase II transcription subunit 12
MIIARPTAFKIPIRVTLNDAKRQAWFADLANPDVPLHKLGKSVPHGAKGHDLLDLLHSNNVAISRAVWFLRVFGANETVSKIFRNPRDSIGSLCYAGRPKK